MSRICPFSNLRSGGPSSLFVWETFVFPFPEKKESLIAGYPLRAIKL